MNAPVRSCKTCAHDPRGSSACYGCSPATLSHYEAAEQAPSCSGCVAASMPGLRRGCATCDSNRVEPEQAPKAKRPPVHKNATTLQAIIDRKPVQYKGQSKWIIWNKHSPYNPLHENGVEWRPMPEPKPDVYVFMNLAVCFLDNGGAALLDCKSSAMQKPGDNARARFVWDSELDRYRLGEVGKTQ